MGDGPATAVHVSRGESSTCFVLSVVSAELLGPWGHGDRICFDAEGNAMALASPGGEGFISEGLQSPKE